jgi:hypothetical protein
MLPGIATEPIGSRPRLVGEFAKDASGTSLTRAFRQGQKKFCPVHPNGPEPESQEYRACGLAALET